MTGKEVKKIRKGMKLNQTEFAHLLGFKTYISIQTMEKRKTISGRHENLINGMIALRPINK